MKKILGFMITTMVGIAVLSTSAMATDVPRPDVESVPVVTSASEENNTVKTEIAPTFVSESSESEGSVRLWAGKNLLVAGNNINTEIKVPTGLMFMAGNNLSLKSESEYGFLFGNNVVFAGSTVRDLYIAGNLNLTAGDIIIRGNVEVSGKFIYNDNAQVQGLQNIVAGDVETFHVEEANQAAILLARVYGKIMSITALFLAIVIISFFCPRLHKTIEDADTVDRFGNTLVKGLGVFLAFPLAAALAFLTHLAAPLGIVAILLYLVLVYLSQSFAGLWIGHMIIEKLFKSKAHLLVEALVGIVTLGALALIPYVGAFTGFLGMILGLGLMFNYVKPRKDIVTKEDVQEE